MPHSGSSGDVHAGLRLRQLFTPPVEGIKAVGGRHATMANPLDVDIEGGDSRLAHGCEVLPFSVGVQSHRCIDLR